MLKFFNTYYPIRNLIFFLGEGGLIFLALLIGITIRFHGQIPHEAMRHSVWLRVLAITFVVQLSLYYHDLYALKSAQKTFDLSVRIVQAIGAACILLAAVYAAYPALILDQGIFFIGLFFLLAFLVSWRFGYQYVCQHGIMSEKVLLVGSGELATLICREIGENLDSGYAVAAVMDSSGGASLAQRLGVDHYADYDTMCELALDRGIRKIIVALDEKRGNFPAEALLRCKTAGLTILDGISFYEALSGKILAKGTLPSWLIFSEGFRRHAIRKAAKRLIDVVLSTVGILLTLPLMALIAAAVKVSSPGPVFFRQTRVGQREKPFEVIKFRTMREDAEATCGPVWATEDDPRITTVGRVLRKLRLDELPQFWNVLKGEMSFVGPRPERPVFVAQLKERLPYYGERHTVKPGLTGWAQVNYGYGASEDDALKKLEYDLFYIKNMSLMLDLFIVLKTVQIVLFGKGGR